MAPKHSRDEQPRTTWPLNEPDRPGTGSVAARLQSRDTAGRHAVERERVEAGVGSSGGGVAERARMADVDFATYVQESLERQRGTDVDDRSRGEERSSFARVGYGSLYRSAQAEAEGERASDPGDDSVLGLNYTTVAPRAPVGDERWAKSLRTFTRAAVWCLPVAVIFLALSTVFGAPTPTSEPSLVSPGTWVLVTALGMGLWLIGVVALGALAANTRMRPWGFVAVAASALGVALLSPVVGVVGLGRPAISRTAAEIQNDANIAPAADRMQTALLDHAVGRFLLVGGGFLLALGAVAVAGLILGSRVLTRHDGWLIVIGVGLAILGAYLGWTFLLTLAAMVMLAGALGLAYTVSRIAPDGTAPPAY